MDMDSGSWLHGYATTNAGGGFMCGYGASRCRYGFLGSRYLSALALSLFLVIC